MSWLDRGLAYAREWLAYQQRHHRQPGLAVAIMHDGALVLEEAFGTADLGTGERLTPRHRVRAASHSKSFTAAGVLRLVEAGRLRLDDPCGEIVPGLHPSVGLATIGQLLSHSGGVTRDGPDSGQFLDRMPYRSRDELRGDLSRPSPIEPGMRLKYSNHGYGLLGLVIENVTGTPYADWMAEHVIRPAGLTETSPDVVADDPRPWASGHSGEWPLGRRVVIPGRNPGNAIAAAGGFVSTAADLARFFRQLDPRATESFLSVASRREMTRHHWRDEESSVERYYGLGIISSAPGPWAHFGHSGGFQGFITRTLVVPDKKLALSVVTNAVDGLAYPWIDGLLHILRRFEEGGETAPGGEDWAGRWWSLWGAVDLVSVGNRVLAPLPASFAPFLDASEIEVTAPDEGRVVRAHGFASPGEAARLVRDASGRVVEVQLAGAHLRSEAEVTAEMEQRYGA